LSPDADAALKLAFSSVNVRIGYQKRNHAHRVVTVGE
jgi:hypothetical protein